jgi:glycosyltransferase involved in cell wall biosynthesis
LYRVDVVVPCYNYGCFLEQCVASILRQNGVEVRVLIIDDASSDNTPEVGQRLALSDPRVTFRRHGVNHGHIATFNEGLLDWASAEYSLLLSADDGLVPGALVRATRLMEQHPEVGMVYGMALIIGDDEPTKTIELASDDYRIISSSSFLQFCCNNCCNPVPTPTAVVRTKVQRLLGGYRAEFPHNGDLEMWMRFALHGPMGVLRGVQGYYRWHSRNMSRRYFDQKFSDRRELVQMFEHVLAPLNGRLPESQQWIAAASRQLANQAFGYAGNALDRGEIAEYRRWIEFTNEIFPRPGRSILPWRLQVRRLLGQTLWQKVRPSISRLRGRPVEVTHHLYPKVGSQWGWWPGTHLG